MTLLNSELVLNDDGSIYHLHLLPEDLATTVILVGDQDRVAEVSRYFDRIEVKKHKREFITHTGMIGRRRISVVSTGIGTDNIDIVLNELDALANIDLGNRQVKPEHTRLSLIRIGTSGSLQPDISVDSVLVSSHGLGLDALMGFYEFAPDEDERLLRDDIVKQLDPGLPPAYLMRAPGALFEHFAAFPHGITATCCGFYAPQGRTLRVRAMVPGLIRQLSAVRAGNLRITNFEMETAGIYGLANVMGHEAVSVNAILANRANGTFSARPAKTVDEAIRKTLDIISAI